VIAIALIAGGVLLMSGAALPWLTLFAGLHQYGGTIGVYGQAVFAAGAVAMVCGIIAVRVRPPWLPFASASFGVVVFAFAVWLFIGLEQIVHRPDAIMFVPRTGPGLFVVIAGSIVITLGSLLPLVRKRRRVFAAGFRITTRRGLTTRDS
jgi:hypothetical protein